MKKIKIGIDINEVLRSRWIQFDKFFVQEFGEEDIPLNPYVYDFFKEYPWRERNEVVKELKEPDDMPNDINPLFYQTDKDGEAKADSFLFKSEKFDELTKKEVYNKFMFEDFVFELFGTAPIMYRGMDLDVKTILFKYNDFVEFSLVSNENFFTIPSTLFFLSKMTSRFSKYNFIEDKSKIWDGIDILITTDPDVLNKRTPFRKKIIKVKRPYNINNKKGFLEILQLNDLNGNDKFEKLIKYKK